MFQNATRNAETLKDGLEERQNKAEEIVGVVSKVSLSNKACFEEAHDLARAILEVNPYTAGHGRTTAAWENVLKRLNMQGRFRGKKAVYLQTRIKELTAFKENHPYSSSGGVRRDKFGLDGGAVSFLPILIYLIVAKYL